MRRNLILSGLAAPALTPALALAQTAAPVADDPSRAALPWPAPAFTIDLWPNGAPGRLHPDMKEHVEETSNDPKLHMRRVQGISRPRVAVFPARNPNGGAMLIIPGGGFYWNYFDHEGYQLADFLNRQGVTCFVLFYRLAADGWDRPAYVGNADAQRAMRVIRSRAAGLKIDPARLGVAGFSAGGFLTASLATRHGADCYAPVDAADRQSAKPFLAEHLVSLQKYPPRQAADTLSLHKALESAMAKLEQPAASSN